MRPRKSCDRCFRRKVHCERLRPGARCEPCFQSDLPCERTPFASISRPSVDKGRSSPSSSTSDPPQGGQHDQDLQVQEQANTFTDPAIEGLDLIGTERSMGMLTWFDLLPDPQQESIGWADPFFDTTHLGLPDEAIDQSESQVTSLPLSAGEPSCENSQEQGVSPTPSGRNSSTGNGNTVPSDRGDDGTESSVVDWLGALTQTSGILHQQTHLIPSTERNPRIMVIPRGQNSTSPVEQMFSTAELLLSMLARAQSYFPEERRGDGPATSAHCIVIAASYPTQSTRQSPPPSTSSPHNALDAGTTLLLLSCRVRVLEAVEKTIHLVQSWLEGPNVLSPPLYTQRLWQGDGLSPMLGSLTDFQADSILALCQQTITSLWGATKWLDQGSRIKTLLPRHHLPYYTEGWGGQLQPIDRAMVYAVQGQKSVKQDLARVQRLLQTVVRDQVESLRWRV